MSIKCCSDLKKDPSSLKICVKDFKEPCLFYKKKGEVFSLADLTPKGVCPDLFFKIYSQYLSLLYDGKTLDNNNIIIQCPGQKSKTYWKITNKKLIFSPIINIISYFFRTIGNPKDLFDKKIVIELINSEGCCPREYPVGTKFSFNQYSPLWKGDFFCPAVFYTMYPFLLTISNEDFSGDPISIQCPADNTSILFEITKSDDN